MTWYSSTTTTTITTITYGRVVRALHCKPTGCGLQSHVILVFVGFVSLEIHPSVISCWCHQCQDKNTHQQQLRIIGRTSINNLCDGHKLLLLLLLLTFRIIAIPDIIIYTYNMYLCVVMHVFILL